MPKQSNKSLPRVHPELEWVGATIREFPVALKSGETAGLHIFLELPSRLIVGTSFEPTNKLRPLSEFLMEVARKPAKGRARLPGTVRVADEVTAEDLRRFEWLKVAVEPTPELDALVDDLKDFFGRDAHEEDYLSHGTIKPEAIGALFRSSAVLYALAPWKVVGDHQLIQVDCPQLDLREAFISIIGNGGESFGFLLFPSVDEYKMFVDVALDPDGPITATWRSLQLEPKEELSEKQLAQIEEHAWEVSEGGLYPVAMVVDEGDRVFPEEKDIEVLCACTTALASFFMRNGLGMFKEDGEPVEPQSQSFIGGDGVTVRLTYPLEAASLYDFDDEDSEEFDDWPEPVVSAAPKVGRNDPCPCGSGKKYKKCCIDKPLTAPLPVSTGKEDPHKMDSRLVGHILDFAESVDGRAFRKVFDDFVEPEATLQLTMPYAAYCYAVKSRTKGERESLLGRFLAERGVR